MKDTALYPHEQILRWKGWSGIIAIATSFIIVMTLIILVPYIGSPIGSVELSPEICHYCYDGPAMSPTGLFILCFVVGAIMLFLAWLPRKEVLS
jgi:TM2 domain-containing membrane protein YozV